MEQINNDDYYPLVDYDKSGIFLVDEILFSHKEKDLMNGTIICYPLKKVNIEENTIFMREFHYGCETKSYNDPNDFQTNPLNESIIGQIENNQYETLIISAIEGEYWDYKLSLQEKNYVKNSDTFILSGRPGTGKTTVILFKLFSIFFNYLLKKKNALIDFNNFNNNINIKIDNTNQKLIKRSTESLRVVFTSLSQHLCERQQTIFEQTMVRQFENNLEDGYEV